MPYTQVIQKISPDIVDKSLVIKSHSD